MRNYDESSRKRRMRTPIYDFVKEYSDKDFSRMHMPGHKGMAFLGVESFDITEIKDADSLYHADGIIAESEENASILFNTGKTLYSAEGSSLCVKSMVYLALQRFRERNIKDRPIIIAGRNAHISFIHAAILLDIDIEWIWPDEKKEYNLESCSFSLNKLENLIKDNSERLIGVYITSPDYLGNVVDIKAISDICHRYDSILLVDNAHGAYLKFLDSNIYPEYRHPMDQLADMSCDSAHKTLPVLTGGAYLHISKSYNNVDTDIYIKAKKAMNIFGSTSPSYLIMSSLDVFNNTCEQGYIEKLSRFCSKMEELKLRIKDTGITVVKTDPLKLTIKADFGISGFDIASILRENNIECEYADEDYLVLMLTPNNSDEDIERLVCALTKLNVVKSDFRTQNDEIRITKPEVVMTARQASFMGWERVNISESLGRICASPLVSCPPAIPVVISGERINESIIKVLKKYNIEFIDCII